MPKRQVLGLKPHRLERRGEDPGQGFQYPQFHRNIRNEILASPKVAANITQCKMLKGDQTKQVVACRGSIPESTT
jgi:hypothetical protein